MTWKCFEVLDEGTLIPVIALKLWPCEIQCQRVLDRAGIIFVEHPGAILLVAPTELQHAITADPTAHPGGRTLREAHAYIQSHFDNLQDGSVIDIQYIIKETCFSRESQL